MYLLNALVFDAGAAAFLGIGISENGKLYIGQVVHMGIAVKHINYASERIQKVKRPQAVRQMRREMRQYRRHYR